MILFFACDKRLAYLYILAVARAARVREPSLSSFDSTIKSIFRRLLQETLELVACELLDRLYLQIAAVVEIENVSCILELNSRPN